MTSRTMPAGLIAVGFQQLTLSNSTAVALNSTIRAAASVLDISVETQSCRYRADGTDPTRTTGVLIPSNTMRRLDGFNGTSFLKFQRTTGTSKVSVMAWKRTGSGTR